MPGLFTLLVVAAAAIWLWRRRDSRSGGASSGARVVFRGGRVEKVEGALPRRVLSALQDVAAMTQLDGEARVSGLGDLEFSSDVPAGVRQQLRNAVLAAWNVH